MHAADPRAVLRRHWADHVQRGRAFLGFCSEDSTSIWSWMPATVTGAPKGLWSFSEQPLAGSASVSPAVAGTITSSGIMRTSVLNSVLADIVLHGAKAPIDCTVTRVRFGRRCLLGLEQAEGPPQCVPTP